MRGLYEGLDDLDVAGLDFQALAAPIDIDRGWVNDLSWLPSIRTTTCATGIGEHHRGFRSIAFAARARKLKQLIPLRPGMLTSSDFGGEADVIVLEQRAIQGLIWACEPRPVGRTVSTDRRLARLERELAVSRREHP